MKNKITLPRLGSSVVRVGLAVSFALGILGINVSADAQEQAKIITFDAPKAGTAAGEGTLAYAIAPSGIITGPYLDGSGVYHGFLRFPNGVTISFDAPGAGMSASEGTVPYSINPQGEITGWVTDSTGLTHGFVRSPDGTMTTFDAPGAAIPSNVPCGPPIICSNGTQGASIDPEGTISGQYVDANDVFH